MSGPGARPTAAAPEPSLMNLLPGADFAEAFRILAPERLDTVAAARRALASAPLWVRLLMTLRDLIVWPLGLATRFGRGAAEAPRIGLFPIIATSPHQVVPGFDDRHLDFRIVVQTGQAGDGTVIAMTTLVRTHGRPGRAYLCAIRPFHRVIARSLLSRAAPPA